MAWDFDGVDQYVRFTMNATLQAAPGGPMAMACVVHFDAVTDGAVIHMLTSAAASRPWIEVFGNWNYGTTAGARSGPAGTTGAWYLAIFSKNTGNIAPEYTLIPLATGTPTSGTMTGGGVTLGDGTAAGAGGIIQVARWGTSATEYINGRVAAAAIWNVYLNQAAREALTTWALWLASSGIQWAVHFDTLSTLTDATGLGGGETARFGTATQTTAADPGALAIDFFAAGGSTVNAVLAATLPAPTSTIVATPRHPAVLAATLPAAAGTMLARPRHPAVLAATLPAPVSTLLAKPTVHVVLAATLPAASGTMLAHRRFPAVLAATLPAPSATALALPRARAAARHAAGSRRRDAGRAAHADRHRIRDPVRRPARARRHADSKGRAPRDPARHASRTGRHDRQGRDSVLDCSAHPERGRTRDPDPLEHRGRDADDLGGGARYPDTEHAVRGEAG